MIEKPTITRWSFTRMSDGALYTKKRVVDAILSEVKHSGVFNADRIDFGLGITGYEYAKEYDKAKFTQRNHILQLKMRPNGKIVVTTANYNEYYISEAEMESWFEILRKARKHAKIAQATADLARTLAEAAKEHQAAVTEKVPATNIMSNDGYDNNEQLEQPSAAAQ